jgi:outer membrane immunogenic protein
VRGRFGYVFGDGTVMSYLTGGLAFGKVDAEGTTTVSGVFGPTPFAVTHAIGHSHVNTGWTVGSGTEGRLLIPGWTYRIEYLYVDLGSLDDPDTILILNSVSGGQIHTRTHFTDNIIRLGLSYQFR